MARKARPGHAQHFEHAIATVITCRSVIKYNSSLSEEQKNELLADMDALARFLQERLVANASIESQAALLFPPLALGEIMAASQAIAEDAKEKKSDTEGDDADLLQGLYKLYNTLLKKKDGNGIELFVSHYNQVMSMLSEIQFKIEKDTPTLLSNIAVGDQIDRVRGFVTDLYCMFTDFATAICNILEGKDIYIDTEKISSTQQPAAQRDMAGVAALVRVYQAHAQLNGRKGSMESRVADASALLVFLEEHLDQQLEKRDEVASQLRNVISLLNDLSYLVIDYAHTALQLLQQGDTSQP